MPQQQQQRRSVPARMDSCKEHPINLQEIHPRHHQHRIRMRRQQVLAGHTREFFRETSVHGFRYVVDGHSMAERWAWILTLVLAFSYSAYFAHKSIIEAWVSPITTVAEVITVDKIGFPAVTIVGEPKRPKEPMVKTMHHEYRFIANVLNAIEFDCDTEEQQGCMERTMEARKDFEPLIENFLRALNNLWRAQPEESKLFSSKNFRDMQSILVRESQVKEIFCTLVHAFPQGMGEEDEKTLVQIIAKYFRVPYYLSGSEFLNKTYFFDELFPIANKSEMTGKCTWEELSNAQLDGWQNAAVMANAIHGTQMRRFRLGDLVMFAYASARFELEFDLATTVIRTYTDERESTSFPDDIMSVLFQNKTSLSASEILAFIYQTPLPSFVKYPRKVLGISSPFCYRPFASCDFKNPGRNFDEIFNVLRYGTQPVNEEIYGDEFVQDLQNAVKMKNYSLICDVQRDCPNIDPKLRGCHFQRSMPRSDYGTRNSKIFNEFNNCEMFQKTFGPNGVAYTFGSAPFWDRFSNNSYNRAFHDKVHGSQSDSGAKLDGNKILDFFIMPDLADYFKWKPSGENGLYHTLAIHHPSQFPLDTISLEAGYWHQITIRPSITSMDPDLISISEHRRQCRFASEIKDDQPGMFSSYSQGGCLYQHKMKESESVSYNCLPWDVPRSSKLGESLDLDEADICGAQGASFVRSGLKTASAEDSDCPADCDVHAYDVAVQRERLTCWELPSFPFHQSLRFLKRGSIYQENGKPYEPFDCLEEKALITRVTVKIAPTPVTNLKRTRRVTMTDHISNLGGVIGLFLGMSLLSLMEILVWICRMLHSAWTDYRDEETDSSDEDHDGNVDENHDGSDDEKKESIKISDAEEA